MRILVYLILALGLSGCFHKPTQDDSISFSSMPQFVPVYRSQDDSYFKVNAACQGNSFIRITYSSELTLPNSVKLPCVSDLASGNLPVSQGTTQQHFKFEVRAIKEEQYTPAMMGAVAYIPLPDPVPGFGITAGGGIPTTGSFASIVNSSIGEVTSPSIQTGTGMISETGLQRVIDTDQ